MAKYLQAGNEHRLWDEFREWTQDVDFDYEAAGARMLGRDIAQLLDADGRERIARLLASQSGEDLAAPLSVEMNRSDPEHARRTLAALLRGLAEAEQ